MGGNDEELQQRRGEREGGSYGRDLDKWIVCR